MLGTRFLHLYPLLLMHDLSPTVSAGKCHPLAALTGRFQPPGKAEVARAAHRVLFGHPLPGTHTEQRETQLWEPWQSTDSLGRGRGGGGLTCIL